jgi:hypothetical protein
MCLLGALVIVEQVKAVLYQVPFLAQTKMVPPVWKNQQ